MYAFNMYRICTLDDFLNKYSSLLHVYSKWFYISKCICNLMTVVFEYIFEVGHAVSSIRNKAHQILLIQTTHMNMLKMNTKSCSISQLVPDING